MTESKIASILVRQGESLPTAPRGPIAFTGNVEADRLLTDLENYPHAFVLACIMDRQIKAERAWAIPFHFAQKLGDFSLPRLLALSLDDVRELMTKPIVLHRYPEEMSRNFHTAVERIHTDYCGNAAAIWADRPSSATVVYRLLQFRGVGQKIATMATNILARDFKIPFADYYSVDILLTDRA
jgi:hypothetical protein